MLPPEINTDIIHFLSARFNSHFTITTVQPELGGCINKAFSFRTSKGRYFLKYNSLRKHPLMFDCEAAGLHILADTKTIKVPEVLGSGQSEPFGWLLLSYIESGTKDNRFYSLLGSQLADLHKTTNSSFGFGQHNYIGSLRQNNNYHSGFGEFFISERIEPQLKTAIDNGLIGRELIKNFEAMFRQLNSLLPAEPPALLHGDLWNGNVMCDSKGNPVLIDPAVYYGHREADIAMTRLFGGFPEEFYSSYNECFPLTKNWQNRTDIFNLYPLLVHVNLFGQGYTGDVLRIICRF